MTVAMIGLMVPSAFASSHVEKIWESFGIPEGVIAGCKVDGTTTIDVIGVEKQVPITIYFMIDETKIDTKKFIEYANSINIAPDKYYCIEMLRNVGICTTPGSAFGQNNDIWHFRLTILPDMNDIKYIVEQTLKFHNKIILDWS